jgi:hypothetical protein
MRLWDAILFSIPYMIFGWVAFQRYPEDPRLWFFAGLWTFLFLRKGPIYTPLVLCAILVALAWRRRWWIAIPLIVLAGYYAQLTRFTWIFAPAMWAGMLYISDFYEVNTQRKHKPFLLAVGAVLAGLLGSIGIDQITNFLDVNRIQQSRDFFSNPSEMIGLEQATSIVSNQALLWQRFFTGAANETGILLMVAIFTAPVLIYLGYLVGKKYWQLNLLAKISISACLLIFAVVGTIISVKIGGGNNLHNMDMYLIALVFCAALAWQQRIDLRILNLAQEPNWIQGTWIAMMFIFAFSTLYTSRPLKIVPDYFANEVLERVNKEINLADQEGEILFIDHRQLLTFGFVKPVPLIDEYEKKYLMDQTFTNNESYLRKFREDLRNQRFSLIISEPLFPRLGIEKNSNSGFGEENDTWVIKLADQSCVIIKNL